MKVEEFTSVGYVNKVHKELDLMFDRLEFERDFRRDRLMTELLHEICVSRM